MSLKERIINSKYTIIVDAPSPKTFGKLGFILFFIAILLVVSLSILYDWQSMLIGITIFICGGFSGRCFQKRLTKK